ncbi:MAG: hypothetical protein AB1489_27865, partial [Acidobacteriota bacterium]
SEIRGKRNLPEVDQVAQLQEGQAEPKPAEQPPVAPIPAMEANNGAMRRWENDERGNQIKAQINNKLDFNPGSLIAGGSSGMRSAVEQQAMSNWRKLGLDTEIMRILDRPQLTPAQRQDLAETFAKLGRAITDKQVAVDVSKAFEKAVKELNVYDLTRADQAGNFRGTAAMLKRAAEVLDRGNLAPGTKLVFDTKAGNNNITKAGLPKPGVADLDADLYYKTNDGVLRLDSVKARPNTLTSDLEKSISGKKQQFARYENWLNPSTPDGMNRSAMVYVDETGPKFNEILKQPRIDEIANRLSGGDPNAKVLQVGDRVFSVNDLNKLNSDLLSVSDQLAREQLKKSGVTSPTPQQVADAQGQIIKDRFGTIDDTLKTLKTNGRGEYGTVAPRTSETMRSARQGGIIGGGIGFATSTYQALQDGKLTGSEIANIAGQTAIGAGSGALGGVVEQTSARFIDRVAGNSVQRATTSVAGRVVSSEVASGTGTALRSVAGRVGGAGVAGAVINAGFATFDQIGAYQRGEVTASQAIGNVAGEATVGLGAGLAGAAAGAAIGSIIPGAGTVVGGVIGFGVGVVAGYLADKGLRGLGVDKMIAKGVTAAIDKGTEIAKGIANTASAVVDAGKQKVASAVKSVVSTGRNIANSVSQGAKAAKAFVSQKVDAVKTQVSQATQAAAQFVSQKVDQVKQTVSNVASSAVSTVQSVASKATNAVSNAVGGAVSSLKSVFSW